MSLNIFWEGFEKRAEEAAEGAAEPKKFNWKPWAIGGGLVAAGVGTYLGRNKIKGLWNKFRGNAAAPAASAPKIDTDLVKKPRHVESPEEFRKRILGGHPTVDAYVEARKKEFGFPEGPMTKEKLDEWMKSPATKEKFDKMMSGDAPLKL